MCEPQLRAPSRLTRREVLAAGGVAVAALAISGSAARRAAAIAPVVVAPGLAILPRDAWGADLPPKKALGPETPQFLLVHHTASPNTYPSGGAAQVIRITYAWHTSNDPSKGWGDVAYNFFVDHDGVVWEGRAGSLAGPVAADATGGSQGFAQLVCLIGDFTATSPTAAMEASLVRVLAWLAERYNIETNPATTASFTSRGSQRFPPGQAVTTPTIAGHRDMSYTSCPGDAVYRLVATDLMYRVSTQRAAWMSTGVPATRLGPTSP